MTDEFAQRLVGLRRQQGYSQEALAAELGLSRQAISKWERAESQPDTTNLIALADLYGITLDELIRDADHGKATTQAQPSSEEAAHDPVPESIPTAADRASAVEASSLPADRPCAAQAAMAAPPKPQQRFRNPWMTFPYPLLVLIAYLVAGFAFRWWHPGWVLFLTIPFYYWAAFVIGKDPAFRAAHTIDIQG